MIRANQEQLFQATNQGLLSIRQSEISYYQGLNVAFGTQAALIGGFTFGVFSINLINHDNGYASLNILADIYWICSAMTIALSVHVILCTMLMQVLGPGLALNGPVGSMARAAEGMRMEQQQIIIVFMLMIITFSISTVLSCWVVMSFGAAVGCSIAFVGAAGTWYYYCERIYLRFYWETEDAGWRASNSTIDSGEDPGNSGMVISTTNRSVSAELQAAAKAQRIKNGHKGIFSWMFRSPSDPSISQLEASAAGSERGRDDNISDTHSTGGRSAGSTVGASSAASAWRGGIIPRLLARDAERESETAFEVGHVKGPVLHANAGANKRGVVLEGYLTKRGGNGHKRSDYRTEPWERRFFTLSHAGNLFIYKNRQDYRNDPKSPIYTRPLRLQDYYVEVYNMNDPYRDTSECDADPANPFKFQITLSLRENVDNAAGGALIITSEGAVPNLQAASWSRAQSSASGTGTMPPLAQALKQAMYRDHWVLQCDTEEELLLWVDTMRELCPSCFREVV